MDVPSKTSQFIQRSYYRKHKQRLHDIRAHMTSHDFRSPLAHRPPDRKRIMMERIKKDEIDNDNKLLQGKIHAINSRSNPHPLPPHHSLNRSTPAYEQLQDGRVDIRGMAEGEEMRCVLPGQRRRGHSFLPPSQQINRPQLTHTNRYRSSSKGEQRTPLESILRDYSRQLKVQDESPYVPPELNQNRRVVFKKTMLLSAKQSCLVEISLMGRQILIVANLLGIEHYSIKTLLPQQRSRELLKEHSNNYEQICERVVIEKKGNKYENIRIANNSKSESESKIKPSSQADKQKLRQQIQTKFLQRNYYTLMKSEDGKSSIATPASPVADPTQKEKISAMVERLSVPKHPKSPEKTIENESKAQSPAIDAAVNRLSGQKRYSRSRDEKQTFEQFTSARPMQTKSKPAKIQQAKPQPKEAPKKTPKKHQKVKQLQAKEVQKTVNYSSDDRHISKQQKKIDKPVVVPTKAEQAEEKKAEKAKVAEEEYYEQQGQEQYNEQQADKVAEQQAGDEYGESFESPAGGNMGKSGVSKKGLGESGYSSAFEKEESGVVKPQAGVEEQVYEESFEA